LANKRIAIIGTVGVPARYGGFETLAEQLLQRLEDKFRFTIFCSKKAYSKEEREQPFGNVRKIYLPLAANGFQSIIYDFVSIVWALFCTDTLLILGVSGALILPFVRIFSRKRIILHIDGLEWKRAKWSPLIRKYLKLSESIGVKFADVIIADNEEISNHLRESYAKNSELIEYGGDHMKYGNKNPGDYSFSVCRIEPENNIEMILSAFSQLPGYKLVLVGNWNNSEYSKRMFDTFHRFDNIELVAPIYDVEKLNVLRANCRLYIHGHSAGGTNPSLVEAMYLGLPVIAFSAKYNVYSTKNKALYFSSEKELMSILSSLDESVLKQNAADMKCIADELYSWDIIVNKYHNIF